RHAQARHDRQVTRRRVLERDAPGVHAARLDGGELVVQEAAQRVGRALEGGPTRRVVEEPERVIGIIDLELDGETLAPLQPFHARTRAPGPWTGPARGPHVAHHRLCPASGRVFEGEGAYERECVQTV